MQITARIRYAAVLSIFLGAPLSSHAQNSSVTLYGLIDTGIEYLSHAGSNGSGGKLRLSTANLTGSRWGLRGVEDLGGGRQAIFVLEGGFNSDDGTAAQGGRLFGRQAFIGYKNQYGKVTVGRQINTLFDMFVPLDPLRYASYGLHSQDSQFTARADNAVKYTGDFGSLTITGLYSFGYDSTISNGGEVPGNYRVGQEMGAGVSNTFGRLGVAFVYDQRRGTSIAAQGNVERRYATGLIWTDDKLQVMAGYRFLQGSITGPAVRAHLYWVGASYQFLPRLLARFGVYRTDVRESPSDTTSYVLGATYALSKRTELYLNGGYRSNEGAATLGVPAGVSVAPGVNQFAVVTGIKHVF